MVETPRKYTSRFCWWPEEEKVIFLKEKATSDYWDRQWQTEDWEKKITRSRKSRYWLRIARRYFPDKNSVILEGGCGEGHLVDAMNHWGYKAIGVDFATQAVDQIKKVMPDLDIRLGDVRALQFEDNYFDGYWSMGVIEHFWEGYGDIIKEMKRVVKPGGYVVLSFPCVSRLDKIKAFFSLYKKFYGGDMPEDFFQFALPIKRVKNDFQALGFQTVATERRGAILGLTRCSRVFAHLNDYLIEVGGKSRLVKFFSYALDYVLSPFCCHSALLILHKNGDSCAIKK